MAANPLPAPSFMDISYFSAKAFRLVSMGRICVPIGHGGSMEVSAFDNSGRLCRYRGQNSCTDSIFA